MKKFLCILQEHPAHGGATCLYMIACHYGREANLATLSRSIASAQEGGAFAQISEAADQLGLSSLPAQLSFQQLRKRAPLPCMILLQPDRFVVIYRISRRFVFMADPALGQVRSTHVDFVRQWAQTPAQGARIQTATAAGEVLLLEPRPAFYRLPAMQAPPRGGGFTFPTSTEMRRILALWFLEQGPKREDG